MVTDSLTYYATIAFGIIGLIITYMILTRKKKFERKYKYIPEDISNFASSDEENGKYFTTDPAECVDIRFTKKGIGSLAESPPMTVFELFERGKNNDPHSAFIAKEYNNKWKYWSRQQLYDEVMMASRGFISLGLNEWESVCIMGFNSPQWFMADLAAIYGGGIACGLYTTNNIGQCQYIINNCNAKIIVVDSNKLLHKFLEIKEKDSISGLGKVAAIIVWDDDDAVITANNKYKYDDLVILTWNELINEYGGKDIDKYNNIMFGRHKLIKPGNCCTLIYTSGTTGKYPKGVMLSHDNLIWTIRSILSSQKHIKFWGPNSCRHTLISYLPLSHIAAQILDIYGPLMIAYNNGDGTIYCARNDALKGSLIKTLQFVKPTVFLGVPRVWEKIQDKMRLIGKRGNFLIKFLSKNAKMIGLQGAYNKQLGGNGEIPFLYGLVSKLIFSTIKRKLGFQRLELAITGAAPIKKSTLEYFHSLGIILIEGYGMSESTALISIGLQYHNKIGCTGPPLFGVNLNILSDQQNEIIVKGRNVMMGYINDMDKTCDIFTNSGFLRSGDIGNIEIDTNLLYITGRIKELLITAGGENIAPVPIEDYIKTILPGISNCVLIGDKRKYLTILITLKTKTENSIELDGDAIDIDINCKTISDAKKSSNWNNYIKNGIKTYNENTIQCVSRAQKIQYFTILNNEFSQQTGEMTDTLKLKRHVIRNKYKHIIDSMY